jgi:dihydrofolate synthase/folylpolyglutamate synthase
MGGAHQVINAMTVIEGINLINDSLKIPYEKIFQGIKSARLVGRTQVICDSPLTILDGAHNPDGLAALAGVIEHCGKPRCQAVIGMCRDKNITEAVSKIIPLVDSFVTVDGFSDRSEDKHSLAEIIRQQGGKAQAAENNLMTEIDRMKEQNPDGLNLVCGSLFLAAEVAAKLK